MYCFVSSGRQRAQESPSREQSPERALAYIPSSCQRRTRSVIIPHKSSGVPMALASHSLGRPNTRQKQSASNRAQSPDYILVSTNDVSRYLDPATKTDSRVDDL